MRFRLNPLTRWQALRSQSQAGITLVEMLIAMALMGFVMLSISNFMIKSSANSASLSMRFKEAQEIQSVVQDIQADLHRGAYISPNSFRSRLEYTTYDPTAANYGVAVKKVYGICYYSAVQTTGTDTTCPVASGGNTIPYLKYSSDAGVTWGSPYRISGFHKYRLTTTNTPKFLYAHPMSDCWDFTDNNGNGVFASGETATYVDCSTPGTSVGGGDSNIDPASRTPDTASKVILNNFAFTTGNGSPEATRTLPPYMFIAVAPGLVRASDVAAVAPGVKDTNLVQSFSYDNASNPTFPVSYKPRAISWDTAHDVLVMGTAYGSTSGKIYRVDRDGVIVNTPIPLANFNTALQTLMIEPDGQTVNAIYYNGAVDTYQRYNLAGAQPLMPISAVAMSNAESYLWSMAYNASTPDYFYMAVNIVATNVKQISKFRKSDGGRETTVAPHTWALPAAFSSPTYFGGMIIDPVTGNFYIALNNIRTASGIKYVDIYKVPYSGVIPSTPDFSINISDISFAAGTTGSSGGWQMAYDPANNRLFMNDSVAKRIYEVVPPKLITPRDP